MKKNTFFILFFFLFFCGSFVEASSKQKKEFKSIDIQTYLQEVKKNHFKIKASESEITVSESSYRYSRDLLYFPALHFNGGYAEDYNPNPLTNYNFSTGLNYTLPYLNTGISFSIASQFSYDIVYLLSQQGNGGNGSPIGQGGQNSIWNSQYAFQINQPLLKSGPWYNEVALNMQKQDILLTKANYENTVLQVLFQGLGDYYNYQAQKEYQKALKEILDDSRKIYSFNKDRFKIGVIRETEFILSEVTYNNNQKEYDKIIKTIDSLHFKLLSHLAYSLDQILKTKLVFKNDFSILEKKSLKKHQVKLKMDYQIALQNRLDVKMRRISLKKTDYNIRKSFMDSILPQLDLQFKVDFVGYGEEYGSSFEAIADNDIDWSIGLNFFAPLGPRVYDVQGLKAERKRNKENFNDLKQNIAYEINENVNQVASAHNNFRKSKKILALYKKNKKLNYEDYQNGKIDYQEYLSQIDAYRNAYRQYINDCLQYQSAVMSFELSKGTLLQYLEIK